MIKYRFVEVNSEGRVIHKFPSKELPVGSIHKGMGVLMSNGNLYTAVDVAIDMELSDPEMHIELLFEGDQLK